VSKSRVHHGHVTTIAFSSVTQRGIFLASGSNDHSIAIWKLERSSLSHFSFNVKAHDAVISALTFGKDDLKNYLFSGCWGGVLKIWTFNIGSIGAGALELQAQFNAHISHISSLCFSTSGQHLITTSTNAPSVCWKVSVDKGKPVLEVRFLIFLCNTTSCSEKLLLDTSKL
jgi:WD40 repeat protein